MAQYQIAFNLLTKVASIHALADALPDGSNKIGEFHHEDDTLDVLGKHGHVVWHHVRDALYHTSSKTGLPVPASLQFPDNITDMAGVTLVSDTTISVRPANTVAPSLTGSPVVGTPFVGSVGTWTPAPATKLPQWQHATSAAGPWTDLADATTTSYTPTAGSAGRFLRLKVTGTHDELNTVAYSPASAAVAAAG